VSPPRRGKKEGRGETPAAPDLDALRARLAETLRSSARERPAARKRGSVLPDEGADEAAPGQDWPPEPWWRDEGAGRPRPVVGGIAARTRKGPIGATWWSRRFLESLQAAMVGGRMERGRSYARKGQVVELHVRPGVVTATVQGSREQPYVVHLRMPLVPGEDWGRIVGALAAQAGYAARMLAGELPHEVEKVFEAEGASLLPAPQARLATECTCPDWENPCKHVAAVCYLLAEEFDRDPFSLLAWRGRERDEVLGELRALRREGAAQPPVADGTGGAPSHEGGSAVRALDEAADDGDGDRIGAPAADDPVQGFWDAGPDLAHVRVRPEAAQVPAALLRLAPRGAINVRGGDLADALAPMYRAVAAAAAARSRR
jgi:uncharacterized Zn finger protein